MSSAPQRVHQQRTKGWRMPAGCKSVARPHKYGNPYTVAEMAEHYPDAGTLELHRMCVSDFEGLVEGKWDRMEDTPEYPSIDEIKRDLRGWNLACFCPPEFPCHADVLLKVANA